MFDDGPLGVSEETKRRSLRGKLIKVVLVFLVLGLMGLDTALLHGDEVFSENVTVGEWKKLPVRVGKRHRLRIRPPERDEPLVFKVRGPDGTTVVSVNEDDPGEWDSTCFWPEAEGEYHILFGREPLPDLEDEDDDQPSARTKEAYVVCYAGDWAVIFRILDNFF